MPGQTSSMRDNLMAEPRLQWRAGQLPGQTRHDAAWRPPAPAASMEGRTIARPDGSCEPLLHSWPGASMEGRTIARPDSRVTI